eukprot:186951_1
MSKKRSSSNRLSVYSSESSIASVLESQSESSSSYPNDTLSVSSIPSMISNSSHTKPLRSNKPRSTKMSKKKNKKKKSKSKVRTRSNANASASTSTPRSRIRNGINKSQSRLKPTTLNHYNETRRRGKLLKNNILNHNQAIRPPTNLFRTPQPKMRAKSARNSTNSSKNKISVAIRLRPLNSAEIRDGMKPIWSVRNTTTLKQIRGTISSYNFEYVCPGIANKSEGRTLALYNTMTKRIVQSSCKGINGCIFAYGQTSSGKTYTMLGTDGDPGITLLALSDIFHWIRNDPTRKYALFISYIEIHNEVINDLLNAENKNLRIVDTPAQGPVIKNCTESAVKTPHDVIQLLLTGEKLRKVSETHSNERSSRSHAIFRIFIQSQPRDGGGNQLSSVLNLVDLAGSESSTNIEGTNVMQAAEAKHINQSLLCLGRVILALSSQSNKCSGGYVPYRASKLTRILQASLGGNANTAVICTMSPCANCLEESLNTLRFAQFTKKVTNHARVNESVDDKAKLRKYRLLVKSLKRRISEYTDKASKIHAVYEKMKKLKKQNVSLQTKIKNHQKEKSVEMERMQEELNSLRRITHSTSIVPSKPSTPKEGEFKRKRLFVSTGESQSEPDEVAPMLDSGYGSDSCRSSVQSVEFTKVIMNLQDKLEEVQANIETLSNRISTAQFIDINGATPVATTAPPISIVSIDLGGDISDIPELPPPADNIDNRTNETSFQMFSNLEDEIAPFFVNQSVSSQQSHLQLLDAFEESTSFVGGAASGEASVKESVEDVEEEQKEQSMDHEVQATTVNNIFASGATSLNTTIVDEIVSEFLENDQCNPSYPISPPMVPLQQQLSAQSNNVVIKTNDPSTKQDGDADPFGAIVINPPQLNEIL